jgi:hypothetical protein
MSALRKWWNLRKKRRAEKYVARHLDAEAGQAAFESERQRRRDSSLGGGGGDPCTAN